MRKSVFGVGTAQVLLTGALIGAIALFGFSQTLPAAIVLGLGLALSSTALGLQSLAESKQLNAPHGRLAFAILLFQDIAAIPLIALVPLLAASGPDASHGDSLQHGLKVFASIAVVIIGGRYLLRPVFRTVARTGLPEVSTATALLVVIGTAWLMEEAGISMALGAFSPACCWPTRNTVTSWNRRSSRSRACCWGCSSSAWAWAPTCACCWTCHWWCWA